MVWTNPCVDILESISAPKKQVLLCCRLGKPANPGDRDNFPIFFRRGKMPMGAYKVEGPQAQARKKNELLSWRLRRFHHRKRKNMTFGYQTFVRVLRFWMVSIRLHKSWSHLEPRFVHGHDFKVNMTVTCQHDEKCPSARRASLHLIAPFNRFSSWEITPSSSMMQMSEELSELLRKDKYSYIYIYTGGNACIYTYIFFYTYINPRALFLWTYQHFDEDYVHLCTTHPAYLWKGVGWFAKPWSQVHSKILHQRTWWRVGSSYWCTLAWASSAQARYIEHVIEKGTYI